MALPGLALALLLMLIARPVVGLGVDRLQRLHAPRAAAARLGRPARRGADRARDVRALLGRAAQGARSSTRSSSSSSSRRSCRARRSNGSRAGSACSRPAPPVHEAPLEVGPLSKLDLVDFAVAGDHAIDGSAVRELGLPRTALIAVIDRGDDTIPPRGSTVVAGRRPALRADAAHDARRPRGRLLALAAPGLTPVPDRSAG